MSQPPLAVQIIRDEHAAVVAVLRTLTRTVAKGPGDAPEPFFDLLRAMLFYMDEFPERLHHAKESDLLFPVLARASPALAQAIFELEADHRQGQGQVRELQHRLLAWELAGESRRKAFTDAAEAYVAFYLEHMRREEMELLPAALELLSPDEWSALNTAFARNRDASAGSMRDPCYDRLFTRILLQAPAPLPAAVSA